MKNKKMWIFIGIIVLILILNRIFGWSAYLGNAENLKFLENMVQDNLLLAVLIYTVLTIVSCVVLALHLQLLRGWYLDRYLERSVAQLRQRLEQWSHLLWDDFSFRTVSNRWQ